MGSQCLLGGHCGRERAGARPLVIQGNLNRFVAYNVKGLSGGGAFNSGLRLRDVDHMSGRRKDGAFYA